MKVEIYCGSIKKRIYSGYMGNFFGVDHDIVLKEGVYFVKIKDDKFIQIEDLLSKKNKKNLFKNYVTKNGDIFVDDLMLVDELIKSNVHSLVKVPGN